MFWGNIFVHIQGKYQKDRMKTEGAYSIWKQVGGRRDTDRRTDSFVSSGAKSMFWAIGLFSLIGRSTLF